MSPLSVLVLVFLMSTVTSRSIDDILKKEPQLEGTREVRSSTTKCGLRPFDSFKSGDSYDNRIINGEFASYGEFPWQASLDVVNGNYRSQYCGATIINEFWLVTAAHCVDRGYPSAYLVTVGNYHWSHKDYYEQRFYVESIIIHESYNGHDYDIALLKIKHPTSDQGIQFNNYVQPACLPDSDTSLVEGAKCLFSGWGKTLDPEYDANKGFLITTEPTLLSRNKCKARVAPTTLTDRMMCAEDSSGHSVPCKGDSGGGLVYKSKGAFTLIGVASWVLEDENKNCITDGPSVYAHVPNLLSWIQSNLRYASVNDRERFLPSRP